jgi:mannosyl-3-phosphoglycerate phosphatase family protein
LWLGPGDQSLAVQAGVAAVQRTANLRGKPTIIVHGRNDTLVPPNFSSRPYVLRNAQVEQAASRLRYIEVTNAQHFDAFLPFPGYDTRFVPLHLYFNRAMDAMWAHLKNGAALPPDRPGAWVLGVDAARIRQALAEIRRSTGLALVGYAYLSDHEVAAVTGLATDAARRARQRDYSETLVNPLMLDELATLRTALAAHGLTIAHGGRFHTITSAASDKGAAVRRCADLLRRKLGEVVTIGIGDSANDLPLLAAVDRPYLVRRPAGDWCDAGDLAVTRLAGSGPHGWREMAQEVLEL